MNKIQFLQLILLLFLWQSNSGFSQVPEFAEPDEQNKAPAISVVKKVVAIGVGIIAGPFLGGVVGSAIKNDIASTFRGAAVGICVFPFLNYDMLLADNKVKNPLNQRWLLAGGNILFVSHPGTHTSISRMFGLNRVLHLSGNTFLRGELLYTQRKFDLVNQKVYYSSMSYSTVNKTNIHFAVDYLDVNLLLDFSVRKLQNRRVHLGTGPAISVPVRTLTKYDWLEKKKVDGYVRGCDFHYNGEESGATFLFFGWVSNVEIQFKRLALRLRFNYGLDSSYQIFPLRENTKMNTLEFLAGFRL